MIGNLGALVMTVIAGLSIDRLGSKPLYFAFTGVIVASAAVIVVPLPFGSAAFRVLIPSLIFFFQTMGIAGMNNAGRNYFFSIIRPKERLNMGILYFVVIGAAGGTGSLAGGALLEALIPLFPGSPDMGFRLYFLLVAVLLAALLYLQMLLKDTGLYSIRNAISFILSPRDLKALTLLRRLDNSKTLSEESLAIEALRDTPSQLSTGELIQRVSSPSFVVRSQALISFKTVPADESVVKLLISEVKNHPYTTAYMAAEIIGERRITEAAKALRQSLSSKDFFLLGKSMIALAQLDDRESIERIMRITERTDNPRVIIHGARALEIFRCIEAIPILLGKLEKRNAPFIRDEIILAVAGILGTAEWFYPLYTAFLERGSTGISLMHDFIDEKRLSDGRKTELKELIDALMRNRDHFREKAEHLLSVLSIEREGRDAAEFFRAAVANEKLLILERFRFLTAAVIIRHQ